jgi:hypothetical protein
MQSGDGCPGVQKANALPEQTLSIDHAIAIARNRIRKQYHSQTQLDKVSFEPNCIRIHTRICICTAQHSTAVIARMSQDSIHAPKHSPVLTPESMTPTQAHIEGPWKQFHHMPFSGAQGVPYFDSEQATNFLHLYELMFREVEEQESTAVKKLPLYCSNQVKTSVEYLAGFEAGQWAELKM